MKEAVRAFIVNKNGDVLLGERIKGISKGEFSLLGGKVDEGESFFYAAKREIGEELYGSEFTPICRTDTIESTQDPKDQWRVAYYFGILNSEPYLTMPVKADEIGGLIFVGPDEVHNEGIPIAFDHRERLQDFF